MASLGRFNLIFVSLVAASRSYKMCSFTPKAVDPTLQYFNLSDGYEITWMHAANSQSKLNQALDGSVKMIEADVQMRHNRSDTIPIMAHPPYTDSNLTLAEFIEKITASVKGMKLDFKSIMAVEPALKLLKNVSKSNEIKNPLWLNADILDGPCFDKDSSPVDPKRFLELCQQHFPAAVLSLGWTTGNEVKESRNMYTWNHVIAMGKLVNGISAPVTFPVRAALVKRSLHQIQWLLDLSRNLTLTVWSSNRDNYDARDLLELRTEVYDKKNVYYDLPDKQAEDFEYHLRGKNIIPRNPYHNNLKVKSYATTSCTDVLVGETKVMFTGNGGWVSSVDEMTAKGLENRNIMMEVSFLSLSGQNAAQNFTIIVASNGLSGANADLLENDGIRMILQNTGEFEVISPDGKIVKSSGKVLDEKAQFSISIWYGQNIDHINFDVSSKADYTKSQHIAYKGESKPSKRFLIIGVGKQQGSNAVLVEEIGTAIALPSSTSLRMVTPYNFVILTLVAISAISML